MDSACLPNICTGVSYSPEIHIKRLESHITNINTWLIYLFLRLLLKDLRMKFKTKIKETNEQILQFTDMTIESYLRESKVNILIKLKA